MPHCVEPASPRQIRRILIANRGEIASRVIRTARALGIATVAVHSDADTGAPYVREADRSVRLPGVRSAQTYLDIDAVVEAALVAGADAIHPGYGFLSENPDFARAVQGAGLIWIGPTPESMEAMALKVEAKQIARLAGVPLVPGAEIPDSLTDAELLDICSDVGYPLLIKASAGGGGKGMREVTAPDEVIEAVHSARREAGNTFGNDTIFVERYLTGARHVEVQVFGDSHGSIVHLFERECSIQRRHQKIIEEAPSPGVTPEVRTRLHETALALARSIGYLGAGTVEFMVAGVGVDQQFFFLEMNTRLQVEHPVTEEITGIDLVAWQIAVAQGEHLPLAQEQITAGGHAIEARLYAEDPAQGDLPAAGVIHHYRVGAHTGAMGRLRVDSGVASGSVITGFYDPMLAKVISWAPTRAGAAAVLADGLSRAVLHGPVTNRGSLVGILRHRAFREGRTTTGFLLEFPEVRAPIGCAEDDERHAVAVAFGLAYLDAPDPLLPLGWRNVTSTPQFLTMCARGTTDFLTVFFNQGRSGPTTRLARTATMPAVDVFTLEATELIGLGIRVDAIDANANANAIANSIAVEVTVAGVGARCLVTRYGAEVFVDDGQHCSAWLIPPRFADHSADASVQGPSTTMPGTIRAIEVAVGDHVTAGQTLVILEAMKMEHRITAEVDGVVSRILVEVGQSVDTHMVVVEFEESSA